MVEHNLNEEICIGYHSHNNMQLAFSNAQTWVDIRTKRNIIIDTSVLGMGRGAGNLNTELFIDYLNDNIGSRYQLNPLLAMIDEILNSFYQKNYWGYSLPNYLSASYNAHPSYANYLDDKKTLTIENLNEIFAMMDTDKKIDYDKQYIEELYVNYMATGAVQEAHLKELITKLAEKKVLIILPGRSSEEEKEKVIAYARREDVISISVNFEYLAYDTDFIFVSNIRRFRDLNTNKWEKCIVTSNIPAHRVYLQTKYKGILNDTEAVRDNSGMMLLKYLIQLGVRDVFIAGLDGYSIDSSQNFAYEEMNIITSKASFEAMNRGMLYLLNEFSQQLKIEFITTQRHVTFGD